MTTLKSLTKRDRNNVDDMGKVLGIVLIGLAIIWTLS